MDCIAPRAHTQPCAFMSHPSSQGGSPLASVIADRPEPLGPDNLLFADDDRRQTGDSQERAELIQLLLEPQEAVWVGRAEWLFSLVSLHAGGQLEIGRAHV